MSLDPQYAGSGGGLYPASGQSVVPGPIGANKIEAAPGGTNVGMNSAGSTVTPGLALPAGTAATLGPVADLSTLNSTYPAASNSGKAAQVGSAAPYVRYISNGAKWRPDANSDALNPLSNDTRVYRGIGPSQAIEWVNAPKQSRVIEAGSTFYDLKVGNPALAGAATSTVSDTPDYWWSGTTGKRIDCTVTGAQIYASWTTSLPANYNASKGLVLRVYNGQQATRNGLGVSLNASGGKSQSWVISGSGFKPGWNLLYLVSPTDTVAQGTGPTGYGSQSGVCQLGATAAGGVNATQLTSVQMTIQAPVAGDFWVFDVLEVATRLKPAVMITYDQAYSNTSGEGIANPFLNLVLPKAALYGIVGGCRYHSLVDGPGADNGNNCKAAIAAGWGILNGTTTRATPVTTAAAVISEYGPNQNQMSRYGLGHAWIANPPGSDSSTNTDALRAVLRTLDIRYSKGSGHCAIAHGIGGIGNPANLGVLGNGGYTAAQCITYVEAAKACGTHLMFIDHYPTGSTTAAELDLWFAYLAAQQTAGLIDVVNPAGFQAILEGLA